MFKSKKAIIIAASAVLLLILGVGGFFLLQRPADLGQKLTFVGEKRYGCVLFWCEVEPYSVYFYATDLQTADLSKHFDAKYLSEPGGDWGGSSANYTFKHLSFESSKGIFTLTFYDNTAQVIDAFHLKNTNKPHIISLTDKDYQIAKASLR